MAFNADTYINVIVKQIGENFQLLHQAVGDCEELLKVQKEYLSFDDDGDVDMFVELHDRVALYRKSIDDLVCNYEDYSIIEPLSVGLFGEWGSGKTHLLKLIQTRVKNIQIEQKSLPKKARQFPQTTIPVFFNAWRFEKEEHLIVPLFKTLLASIELFEKENQDERVKKELGRTKERLKLLAFSLAKGLKLPTNIRTTVANLLQGDVTALADFVDLKEVQKALKEESSEAFISKENLETLLESDRIESVYMNIPQWIEKITVADNINFVFLIDDLDRCLPENTLKMLESIKLFLDVPSCAFVLAIDDDVVERGVAYHYRDYLKQVVRVDGKEEHRELPITGHEYLEKMVQLPFRIPVITNTDVFDFLQKNYGTKLRGLFKEEKLQSDETPETVDGKGQITKSDEVMKFFADTIPPKPRKIKRTATLFYTKIKILQALKQRDFDPMLVAKLTLLELFAPKLLRFIQNNNYKEMFDILHDFSNLEDAKDKEAKNSLENSSRIKTEIKKYKNEGDRRTYTKLLEIVEENYHSRMVFKLDPIFKTRIDKTVLTEAMEQKVVMQIAEEQKELVELMSKEFYTLLFGQNETQWRKAFDDNALFEEGKALLTPNAINEITKQAKNKEGFCDNPKWLLIIAEYITQTQFIKLLEVIYSYTMNPYQTTFEEYDKYCEATGAEKPNDQGWGRGKRPVINVSWHDATAYAKWLSEKATQEEGKKVEYRLPTEDEWYLACNVGVKTTWHFGDDENQLKEYAWYSANSYDMGEKHKDYGTHEVGTRKPNKLGLYDMHGNVWEWCEDWYDEEKNYKVLRGGSWSSLAIITASSYRYRNSPDDRNDYFGFRLQRTSF